MKKLIIQKQGDNLKIQSTILFNHRAAIFDKSQFHYPALGHKTEGIKEFNNRGHLIVMLFYQPTRAKSLQKNGKERDIISARKLSLFISFNCHPG